MAQSSAVKTYDAVGNREDLTDVIATITRHETPLFSDSAKVPAKATYHEWQKDSLSTGNSNAAIEGADFSFSVPSSRTRVGNYTQIFTKSLEVSETQREVSVAGLEDEFAYQMEKRMKEIATDIEAQLFSGSSASGASGTARQLEGLLNFISTNVETGSGTGNEALTEDMYNDLLQSIWDQGGRPDVSYVNSFQKRQISSFTTSNTRYLMMDDEKRLVNSVSVYESDFGVQEIKLEPFIASNTVAAVQSDLVRIAMLRGIKPVDVAKVADSKRGALVGELTLEVGNEAACGKITQLSTS